MNDKQEDLPSMTNSLEEQLNHLGSSPLTAPDPAFANRLEADLRTMALERQPRARPLWQPILGFAVAGLLVLVGFVSMQRFGDNGGPELVMVTAEETRLVLPDGTQLEATAGSELTNGTRILVGDGGGAVIGHLVLPPGTEAIIVDGQVQILESPYSQGPSGSTSTVPAVGSISTSSSPTDDGPGGSTAEPTTTPDRPATTTTTIRETTIRETTLASQGSRPATSTTTDGAANTSPTTTSSPQTTVRSPRSPVLGADPVSDHRVRLTWSYQADDALVGWVVIAGAGDEARTVVVLRDPGARSLMIERPPEGMTTFRVVAKGAGGQTLAESNPVTVFAGP